MLQVNIFLIACMVLIVSAGMILSEVENKCYYARHRMLCRRTVQKLALMLGITSVCFVFYNILGFFIL